MADRPKLPEGRETMTIADHLAALVDRVAVTQVVNDWGLFRDAGRWRELRALYARKAEMLTTWYAGDADGFVARSIEAAAKGMRAQHFIGAATMRFNGGRAVAETRMILMVRAVVADVPAEVTCHGRFHDRFVREDGAWRIKRRVPVYEKDRLDSLDPGRLLTLDHAALARFSEGYRHLAYVQSLGGGTLVPGLPTARSKEEAELEKDSAAWLADA